MSIQKQLHLYSSGWQNMSARCSVERSWGGGWPFGEGWGWCQHSWFSQYHTSLTVCLYSSQCHTSHLSVLQSVPHFPSVCLYSSQYHPSHLSVCLYSNQYHASHLSVSTPRCVYCSFCICLVVCETEHYSSLQCSCVSVNMCKLVSQTTRSQCSWYLQEV